MTYVILPLIIIILLLAKGFFSGSEIALVNADKIKLKNRADKGHKGSELVLSLFRKPEMLLGTTLVGTNVSTVMLVTIVTALMIKLFGDSGDLYATLIITPVLLILGEIVPKSIFQQKSDAIAPVIIYPLRVFSLLFFPIIFIFSRIARYVATMVGSKKPEETVFVIREQIRSMVEMAEGAASVGVFDRVRIAHAIRFSRTTVGETMTPLAEAAAVDINSNIKNTVALVRKSGYSRLPVYEGNITNIIGIVRISPWEMMDKMLSGVTLRYLTKPALYVPSHQPVDQLLAVLRDREEHMAIVVDEFGSAVGVITMEDILEQVLGKIDSGADRPEAAGRKARSYEKLDEDVYIMDSRISISEINEIFGIELPSKEFHTVGGLVTANLQHMPREGESITEKGLKLTVVQANSRQVLKVRVERAG